MCNLLISILMITFQDLSLITPLRNAIAELGFAKPTPIQQKSFSVVRSGADVVGIAQTGTGKRLLICCLYFMI